MMRQSATTLCPHLAIYTLGLQVPSGRQPGTHGGIDYPLEAPKLTVTDMKQMKTVIIRETQTMFILKKAANAVRQVLIVQHDQSQHAVPATCFGNLRSLAISFESALAGFRIQMLESVFWK